MKAHTILLIAIVALLLLGGMARPQPGQAAAPATAAGERSESRSVSGVGGRYRFTALAGDQPPGPYTVERASAAGGLYRLTVLGWQVDGSPAGGAYRLRPASAPAQSEGGGCCCTHLPCVLRGY